MSHWSDVACSTCGMDTSSPAAIWGGDAICDDCYSGEDAQ